MSSRILNTATEVVLIAKLKSHPRNANVGDIEAIKNSMAVNGFYGTVIVNKRTGHIVAGNHRVEAAKALGWDEVPVTWIDVSAKEELRIMVADNRTARLGKDDDARLMDILAELSNTDLGLDGTGFSAEFLDGLIGSLVPDEKLVDESPDQFDEFDEGIETDYRCPKCGYEWSGKTV